MLMKNILGLILSFLFFAAEAQTSDSGWKVQLNETAPTFVVPGKDSTLVSSADLKGKVVLLNFFATWCPPCREELPRLQKEVWDKYKDHPKFSLLVLAREQNWDKIDPFLAEHKFTLPIYPDLERNVFGLFACHNHRSRQYAGRCSSISNNPTIYQSLSNILSKRAINSSNSFAS